MLCLIFLYGSTSFLYIYAWKTVDSPCRESVWVKCTFLCKQSVFLEIVYRQFLAERTFFGLRPHLLDREDNVNSFYNKRNMLLIFTYKLPFRRRI